MRSPFVSPVSEPEPILALGFPRARPCACFLRNEPDDPLERFPTLRMADRPYNRWLTERILEPTLEAWRGRGAAAGPVAAEYDAGCELALGAFAAVLPAAIEAGDSAILAALAVTANLVRTLGLLGEALADGDPGAEVPRPLSRLWCGLEPAPEPPGGPAGDLGAARLDRRGLRELAVALGSPPAALERSFAEALALLRGEIRPSGLFTAGDLRQLQTIPRLGAIRRAADLSGSGE